MNQRINWGDQIFKTWKDKMKQQMAKEYRTTEEREH